MENKKEILKKYVGKGGLVAPSPFKIIKMGLDNAKNKMQSGITTGIKKFVGDTPAGKMLKEGISSQKSSKQLKSAIQKAKIKGPSPILKPRLGGFKANPI